MIGAIRAGFIMPITLGNTVFCLDTIGRIRFLYDNWNKGNEFWHVERASARWRYCIDAGIRTSLSLLIAGGYLAGVVSLVATGFFAVPAVMMTMATATIGLMLAETLLSFAALLFFSAFEIVDTCTTENEDRYTKLLSEAPSTHGVVWLLVLMEWLLTPLGLGATGWVSQSRNLYECDFLFNPEHRRALIMGADR